MDYLKTDALVLRARDFSKTSQVISVLTLRYGKRALLAKGSRRPGNAFEGPFDTLHRGELVFMPRQRASLDLATEFALDTAHRGIRSDPRRIRAAMAVVELVDKSTAVEDRCPELYRLATATLERMDSDPAHWLWMYRVAFELGVLEHLGRDPQLGHCVVCRRPRPAGRSALVDVDLGGVVCRGCRRGPSRRHLLRAVTLDWLDNLKRGTLKSVDSPGDESIIRKNAESFLRKALEWSLERHLVTLSLKQDI